MWCCLLKKVHIKCVAPYRWLSEYQSWGWACGGAEQLCYRSPVCQRCWLPIFNINSRMFVYALWNAWKMITGNKKNIYIFYTLSHMHTNRQQVYLSATSQHVTQGDRISMIIWFYLYNMNPKSIISVVLGFLCKTLTNIHLLYRQVGTYVWMEEMIENVNVRVMQMYKFSTRSWGRASLWLWAE